MNTRVARTHAAVMEAATQLLVEGGPDALTIDGVVARSGVAKSTVYRHWATRDELVADVFEHVTPQLEDIDPTLDFATALRTLVGQMARMMSDPHWQRMLPALMMLKLQRGEFANLEERMSAQQMNVCTEVFRRGAAEGHVAKRDDPEMLLTLLVGPLMMAGLTGSVELNDEFAERVVEHFLAAMHAPAPVH